MSADHEHRRESKEPSEVYPGVEPAQMFVLPSYQWMLQRIESADSRLQAVVTFIATTTFAFPALAATIRDDITFSGHWFILAMVCAAVAIVTGIVARIRGGVKLVNPDRLYNNWLDYSPWEFRKNALYWAGQDFRTNAVLIGRKALMVTIITGLFIAEMLFLLLWITGA